MEEARQKNSEDLAKTVGRMEEALEEENISKLKNIYFLSFSKIFWKNGRS